MRINNEMPVLVYLYQMTV